MNEPRTSNVGRPDSATPLQLRSRANRGVIAGYIHELSERHNGGVSHDRERTEGPIEPTQGD